MASSCQHQHEEKTAFREHIVQPPHLMPASLRAIVGSTALCVRICTEYGVHT